MTKGNILYIDVETTGLNPIRHGIHHIAMIHIQDGVEKMQSAYTIDPRTYPGEIHIDEKALTISGTSISDMDGYMQYSDALKHIRDDLEKATGGGQERLQFAAYNVPFDIGFVQAFLGADIYKRYFSYQTLDILDLVRRFRAIGAIETESAKLTDICAYFGIEFEAHNAREDIRATLKLHQRLLGMVRGR